MKVKLGRDGRLAIPAEYRTELGIGPGDTLALCIVEGEARLKPFGETDNHMRFKSAAKIRTSPVRVVIAEDGSVALPSEVRKILGMNAGDTVITIVEDGDLLAYTFEHLARYIQKQAKKHPLSDGRLLSEELIQERQAEARAESHG